MDYKELPIQFAPYVKGKGFCPNPLVVNGIPDYADGSKNTKVIGTPEYETFWTEQLYRCINGYNTGGIFIPGRFYYYMNFNNMNTVHGIITPDFCDMHLELCYIMEWCKANGKNLVVGKKRRAGISEFTQKAIIDYGYRFSESYQAGIAAGQKKYAEDFMTKWEDSEALLQNEFRVNSLLNNPDEVVSGYELMENGKTTLKNNACKIFVRTMHNNPNMFKGLFLNDVVAEESGEFENLCEFISATNDCLMDGDTQVGMFMIYGTGGNINKGSKDFKKVWENPNDYNAVKYLITGDRFKKPFYGGATRFGKDVSYTPNLLKKYKPYQIIGMEDTEAAMENIMAERERLKKGELKKYMEHLQNNPINESEIFRKMFSNNFDIQKINEQQDEITINKNKYSKWKLEWVINEKGERVNPLRVKAVPAKDIDDESECILILDEYHPDKKYKNLYVGGCLVPGEKVLTSFGLKNVEDVTLYDKLINKEGELVDIINLQTRPKIREDIYKITVSNTYRTTTFTKEHPIYVSSPILNSDKTVNESKLIFDYKKASDVNENDWIKYPNIYNREKEINNDFWNFSETKKDKYIESPLNENDFWWFIGIWLGDGWCDNDGRVSVAFNSKEEYYISKFEKVVNALFKRKVHFRDRNKGALEVSFNSKQLSVFLLKNFGKYSYGKFIPEWAKYIKKEYKFNLIHGYLCSDGSISKESKRGYYSADFVSINLELLESIQDIGFSIGLVGGINKLRDEKSYSILGKKESKIRECYHLRFGHHDTVYLKKQISDEFDIKLKKIDLNNLPDIRRRSKDGCFISECGNYIYFKVRKIEKDSYTGLVYNFECETHTFMCHHINTHNCDPYDQDKGVSKSLGAMCVITRSNPFGIPFNMPVAVISTRPKRKEIFFEMCLKLSVYYDLVGNTLGDKAGSSGIINWYKDSNCMKYLAPRPTKFESMNSEQSHEFWFSINNYSRPLMVGAMQTAIHDHVQNIWFPELINQLGNFDEVEIGSDNDLADAYGIALVQSISLNVAPRDDSFQEKEDPFSLGGWVQDKNGNMVPSGEFTRPGDPEADCEGFGS